MGVYLKKVEKGWIINVILIEYKIKLYCNFVIFFLIFKKINWKGKGLFGFSL